MSCNTNKNLHMNSDTMNHGSGKASFCNLLYNVKWGRYSLRLGVEPCIMGIINTTPDSFSDGGKFFACEDAVSHGIKLFEQGADILDIGGESSRPFSEPVSVEEELERVIPVIEKLSAQVNVPISIDTVKSEVASKALDAGASIINDISAMEMDPLMMELAAQREVPVILMHMKGSPATMQINPDYDDFLGEIISYLADRAEIAIKAGISPDHIIVDPGIGFGKRVEHNLMLIRHLDKLSALGFPVLMGPSRKSFIQKIIADKRTSAKTTPLSIETECGTMASVAACLMNGAHIVRVHDVASARVVADIIHAVKIV
ncbi:7,8-dihydropteroate synthase [Desulfamplus magnetovallimortis]|uniref:Dihydropteroate synthase n=1 Tax=Desulfamplus magnetovallimortis TaxID=1246637 RepID=A0A1W1H510_9BACT|nr:dihydropteroate synthase [Desulfamplus magnetovallimortis]SLM27537.1 7,8-dihydropteroate synthase [Desulfamplus magnetovallimortis]